MKYLPLLISLFYCTNLLGQLDSGVFKAAMAANEAVEIQNSINPFNDMIALDQYQLNDTLFNYWGNDAEGIISKDRDSVHSLLLIDYYNSLIDKNLRSLFENPQAAIMDFKHLLNKFDVVVSDDGKLTGISYFSNSGGSYQSYEGYMLYKRSADSLIYEQINEIKDSNGSPFQVFQADGYGIIKSVEEKDGIKYILIGGVKGCTTCHIRYVDVVHFQKGQFVADFQLEIMNRSWEQCLFFEEEDLSLKVKYELDDLAETCHCGIGQDDYSKLDQQPVYGSRCTCEFQWKDGTYVLVNSQLKAPEKKD